MERDALIALANLVRGQRVASLGTLRSGAPFVSLVVYAADVDFGAFWLHLSQLAFHTRAIREDPRVGLMIAEADHGVGDAQTLARLSIQGQADPLPADSAEYDAARSLYVSRFPEAELNFDLGDFSLYRIVPNQGRLVAGFGMIYNVTPADFQEAARIL